MRASAIRADTPIAPHILLGSVQCGLAPKAPYDLAAWMARHGSVQKGMHWLDRAAGVMFIGFGVRLAMSDNPSR